MGLNRFGFAMRGVFATGVTMAWRQSSGVWEGKVKNAEECRGDVGTQGFQGFGKEPFRASSLIGVESFDGFLGS